MKAVEFEGCNEIIGKDQPQYAPLPAIRVREHNGMVITCHEMTDEELQEVIKTKRIYLSQWTFNDPLQPILLATNLADLI